MGIFDFVKSGTQELCIAIAPCIGDIFVQALLERQRVGISRVVLVKAFEQLAQSSLVERIDIALLVLGASRREVHQFALQRRANRVLRLGWGRDIERKKSLCAQHRNQSSA